MALLGQVCAMDGELIFKKQTFAALIQNADEGGVFGEVPFDVESAFGLKRPKVKDIADL